MLSIMEIWKRINEHYSVSSLGRIKSFKRKEPKILNGSITPSGYAVVGICGKLRLIHRLVAEAFIPNPYSKETVNHIDGIKNNNIVSNLEWNTQAENNIHAIKSGLRKLGDECKKLQTNQ